MYHVWTLNKGADRRIRSFHPWIFSNELSRSPKGHIPGMPVELRDVQGNFLAYGYGNPHSLIAFRALSFQQNEKTIHDISFFQNKLVGAWKHRFNLGLRGSFRLCFGEGDGLPGLVVDYYKLDQERGQVFAIQVLTGGINYLVPDVSVLIQGVVAKVNELGYSQISWEKTGIVLRNDVNVRKLEGLEVEEPRVIKNIEQVDLNETEILIESSMDDGFVPMTVDLVNGQKTGFFLDQAYNIRELVQLTVKKYLHQKPTEVVRVADLCTYVGQWSAQLAYAFKKLGIKAEFTLVDISEKALLLAQKNVARQGVEVITKKLDVVQNLDQLASTHYDIVVADPPAFIKAKKDIPTGKHAYLKVNTHAFRMVKKGGLVVSCSCSGLLTEEDFIDSIKKSILRNKHVARVLAHGRHAPDHPMLLTFPEGFYLKMYIHSCF